MCARVRASSWRRGRSASCAALLCAAWCLVALPQTVAAQEGLERDQKIEGPLQEQLTEYWSVERDLPMITQRLHERSGRVGVGIFGGILPSEPFYFYAPLGARVGYFFTNELGVEVSGHYMLAFDTELSEFLQTQRSEGFDPTTDAEDLYNWGAEAVVAWHPLYGKWALLQRKLSHLDLGFFAGAGAMGVQRPDSRRVSASSAVVPVAVIGAGLNFYLRKGLVMRLDWRSRPHIGPTFDTDTFADQGFMQRMQVPTDFTLGLSYLF